MNKIFLIFQAVIFFAAFSAHTQASPQNLERNKSVVSAFYDLAFNQHKPKQAVEKYVGSDYIQHNPFVETGKQAFIDFFLAFQKQHPKAQISIKRIVAEGDLIVLHVHSMIEPGDRGRAVVDIFRLSEDGKIVEHWDVGQVIPGEAKNSNTMF